MLSICPDVETRAELTHVSGGPGRFPPGLKVKRRCALKLGTGVRTTAQLKSIKSATILSRKSFESCDKTGFSELGPERRAKRVALTLRACAFPQAVRGRGRHFACIEWTTGQSLCEPLCLL
ncbi:hypothetical protein Bbelb_134370 [Branchiostoma belcheri]|nr:hypothetical protein Bbelb_134370 [Branchiostoma belcheri]